ncbi:MAG: phosphatase PAP2 family protein [Clostridia bacterium]|nr:phosphatase PAP2 family protein [Clostridia bacterium]
MEWQMNVLRAIAEIRNPVLDVFFGAITYLGSEIGLIVVALIFFWCIDKRQGYYLFTVGFVGTILNQFLKLSFRVDRPWVYDPSFEAVESAKADAGGFSFPSGHTQSSVGLFGGIARTNEKKWVRYACLAPCILVPFSRMYLGVHTPMDVGVSILIALILVFALHPLVMRAWEKPKHMAILLGTCTLLSLAFLLYVELFPFPKGMDTHNMASGKKNAYTLFGTLLGLCVVYLLDARYLHFDTRATVLGQTVKLVIGAAIVFAIKTFAKAPLTALLGADIERSVRYFLLVLFAGGIWPLVFPYLSKLGKKEEKETV